MMNNTLNRIYILSLGLGLMGNVYAQDSVGLYRAVELSLIHNYDVNIAGVDREMAENNAEAGNAGLLPTVYLDGGGSYAVQSAELQFASPEQPPINAEGAATLSYNAGAYMDYVLFNGGRRLHRLDYLRSLGEDARLRERLSMENTTLNVANSFLEVVRLTNATSIAQEAIGLSLERVKRAEENYKYGNTTKLQLLNAEVDLRNDSITYAQQGLQLNQALRNLNMDIGLPADTSLAIATDFEFMPPLEKNLLLDKARSQNTAYLRAETMPSVRGSCSKRPKLISFLP